MKVMGAGLIKFKHENMQDFKSMRAAWAGAIEEKEQVSQFSLCARSHVFRTLQFAASALSSR